MQRNHFGWALLLSLGVVSTAFLPPDVRYVRVTRVELEGSGGQAMSLLGRLTGQGLETTETVYISGHRMRTDRDKSSSIIDLDAETITELDHRKKEYTAMTLSEYRAMLLENMSSLSAMSPEGAAGQSDVSGTSFEVSVEATDETKELLGQVAKRYFVTLTTQTDVSAPDANPSSAPGEQVMLADTWLLPSLPGRDEEAEFQLLLVEKLWGGDAGQAGAMGAALALLNTPQYRNGLVQMAEEMAKLGGVVVESTTYTVIVPAGVEFDRAAVVAPSTDRKGSGLGALARGIARRAAGQEQPNPAPEVPSQRKLMSVYSATQEASTASIEASLFQVPDRYKQVDRKRN